MSSIEAQLQNYRSIPDDDRLDAAKRLIKAAPTDGATMEVLLYVLNEERDSVVRLAIVEFLEAARRPVALRALTKAMFDPDPKVRAHGALGVANYTDVELLVASLPALFDALPDPATRAPADRAIRLLTGRAPERVTVSERERIRLGEHPRTIWPQ